MACRPSWPCPWPRCCAPGALRQKSPCHILRSDPAASSAYLSCSGREAGVLRPQSSAFPPCPSAADRWGHPCRWPNNALGSAVRSFRSSPVDRSTSKDRTSQRGDKDSQSTRRNRASKEDTCSGRLGGPCQTERFHNLGL